MSTVQNNPAIVNYKQRSTVQTLDNGKMGADVAKEFNTYQNWGEFQLLIDPLPDETGKGIPVDAMGVKSLFNNSTATYVDNNIRKSNNMPIMDAPGTRKDQRIQTACTVKDLVEASTAGLMGRQIYNYSDFAYCRYLGKVPNNYLITLRRFPMPCGDHIDYNLPAPSKREKMMQDHAPDVGRLVTWMGTPGNEMGNILKYSVSMKWKDNKADWNEAQGETDSSSPMAQLFNAAAPTYQKQVQQGYAGSGIGGAMDAVFSKAGMGVGSAGSQPYNNIAGWRDSNKVYGPVDVLMRTTVRDQGIEFNQEFSLVFDYQLKSYNGVNGKSAMMDLLGNILAVTYTNGKFWGGGYRGFHAHQSNVFANLPIFQLAGKGGLNDSTAVMNAFSDSISAIGSDLKKKGNGSTVDGIIETIKGMGGMLLGGMLNKLGRPAKMTAAALLTPAPTGMWHLTVGNPKAPILTVGNLILTGADIEHYGPLGIDDFPTGIRVTCKLKHAKDRDNAGIEQMFLRGDMRYYVPMSSEAMKIYEKAPELGSDWKSRDAERQEIQKTWDKIQTQLTEKKIKVKDAERLISNKKFDVLTAPPDKGTLDSVLLKYFGTTNRKTINIAIRESAWGSVEDKSDKTKYGNGGSGGSKI